MRRRDVSRALARNGCRPAVTTGRGPHEKWVCGCQEGHTTALPRHGEITAYVVGMIIKQLPCLPKGWIQ